MTQRKGRATPVVAAGAIVAVAAADVVRRRWQSRAPAAARSVGMPSEAPKSDRTAETSLVTETPQDRETPMGHRAATGAALSTGESAPVPPKHRGVEVEAVGPNPEPDPGPISPEPEHSASEHPASTTPEPEPVVRETVGAEAPAPEVVPVVQPDPQDPPPQPTADQAKAPNWWHRDHPTFSALTGFFAGIAFLVIVPGAYAGILAQIMDYERAEALFPFVLLTLIVPIALMTVGKTRRFGLFMLIGLFSTLIVVGGVAALVLYVLFAMN